MEDTPMTFWDHLEELRRVLLRCIIVVALFAILAFVFKDEVFWIIFAPKSPDFLPCLFGSSPEVQLINTELTRQFIVHMMTSFYVGIIVAAPYIIFELYRFISPGLYEKERRYTTPLVISCEEGASVAKEMFQMSAWRQMSRMRITCS